MRNHARSCNAKGSGGLNKPIPKAAQGCSVRELHQFLSVSRSNRSGARDFAERSSLQRASLATEHVLECLGGFL